MYTAAFPTTYRPAFAQLKDRLKALVHTNKPASFSLLNHRLAYNPAIELYCKCCNWKGKSTDARYKVLVLEHTAEVELFCPQCHSYAGFVNQ